MSSSHHSAIERFAGLLRTARESVLRPPPRMNLPDWADTYRHLSTSSGAVGGPWQTHRVEVARGPMMAVTEPGVSTITAMCCTQILKTELILNIAGYYAHLDPAPLLLLQPKDEMVEAFSKERVAPMLSVTPVLRQLVGDVRTRSGDDTIKFKRFPGGFLAMASAGSPSNLAMRAIRVTLLDEIDKYEVTKEGDPVLLAEERTATFYTSRLRVRACSPTWEETSRIYKSFREGDQRRPYVTCPHCEHEQTLDFFKHVHWDKDEETGEHYPHTAALHCEECGAAWSEAERLRIVTGRHSVRWMQTRPFMCCSERQDPQEERLWRWDEKNLVGYAQCKCCGGEPVPNHHASFVVSKLYSPFTTVLELVEKWLAAKDDPEAKQTFYNTQLGTPYRAEASKEVDSHWLMQRREQYDAEVPEGVVVLTCGVDVQTGSDGATGRLEYEVVGWGVGEESWSIKADVIYGDPAKPEIWRELDKVLQAEYRHAYGFPLYITGACIDSGGHYAQDVYRFAVQRVGRNVWAIKGASDKSAQWSPVWPQVKADDKHKRYRTGFRPVLIGVSAGKEAIRQRLLVSEPGPGYCHFPEDRPEGWFHQMTSERLILEKRNGVGVRRWVKNRGAANEALDCRVYAYAALQGLYNTRKLDLERRAMTLEARRIERAMPKEERAELEAAPAKRRVVRSPWMGNT